MIDTVNLHPPGFGPRANPLLFGVSEGLLRLFPLPTVDRPAVAESETALDAHPYAFPEPATSSAEA